MVKEVRLNRRKSHEQYIKEVSEIFGDQYDHTLTEYETGKGYINVTCKEHGVFRIKAQKHLSGQGCKECGKIKAAKSRTLTQEQFISDCTAKHGDTYDYSETVYINDSSPVDVICKKHGKFTLVATKHKQGDGCRVCGFEKSATSRRISLDEFIKRAIVANDGAYTYKNVVMGDSGKCRVSVTCPIHGDFLVSPDNHARGCGCPECAGSGYSKFKPGIFYILIADNITKVGITNRTVKHRLRSIRRTSGLDFSIYSEVSSVDGAKIQKIEKATLLWLRSKYKGVEQVFDGFTECFLDVALDDLLSFVIPITE